MSYFHMMRVSTSICLNCEKPIRSGRSDKKFCDAGCKDEYNNAIKTNEHSQIRTIGLILKKNMRILKKLYDAKNPDRQVRGDVLVREGFEFGFYTHIAIGSLNNKNEFHFCYNFGYREVKKDHYQIYPLHKKVQVKGGRVFHFK